MKKRFTGSIFTPCVTSILKTTKWSYTKNILNSKLPLYFSPTVKQARYLNLHEYQSKSLMEKYGIKTQRWRIAETPEEADRAAKELNCKEIVVKAQILAGGRGKGVFDSGYKGGVRVVPPSEVKDVAKEMLGKRLITKQTSKEGTLVQKVMVAESIDIETEMYLSMIIARNSPLFIGSRTGGVNIEETEDHGQFTYSIPSTGLPETAVTDLTNKFLKGETKSVSEKSKIISSVIRNLYKMFVELDALQIEINPLAYTTNNDVYCVDAKFSFDDNAKFRHKDLFAMGDDSESDPREVEAEKYGLNYIGMDGNIGCMVNGAGLAMATMDIIKLHKGTPANFLDVGGGANEEQVAQAFKILTKDKQVKAILVNIFGGIMKCDIIANGIINAARVVDLKIPLVVRLEGTNVDKGKELLKQSGLKITTAEDLDDAAKKAVASIS